MTGVTELQQCERTKDAWLRSVQDEFRLGKVTEEAHAVLHGAPTMQPGSLVNGNMLCAKKRCTERSSAAARYSNFNNNFAEQNQRIECLACKEERKSRTLVADTGNDPRFQ